MNNFPYISVAAPCNMRFNESLSYLNNNNNNNHHANDNIDRLSTNLHSNANITVKTFTSNGNQQLNNDSDLVKSSKTAAPNPYFEIAESIGSDVLNSQRNWQLETDFGKTLSAYNETYCFYGSHRKLKSRENLHLNDDDNANGNDVDSNELSLKESVDLIDDSSSDIEAEITRLIDRSNLCRQNFEDESYKEVASTTEEQLMDEEGKTQSIQTDNFILSGDFSFQYFLNAFFRFNFQKNSHHCQSQRH